MQTLISFILFFSLSTAYADELKVYVNKKQGYEFKYPVNAQLSTNENVRQNFYLDPLQPIENYKIDLQSIVTITFPDKYLFILSLKKAPDLPPSNSQKIIIGEYQFWRKYTSDAAMGHTYEYYTYYLVHKNKIYVFIFLFTSNTSDQRIINTEDLNNILETLRLA